MRKSKGMKIREMTQKIIVPIIMLISIAAVGLVLSMTFLSKIAENPIVTDDDTASVSAIIVGYY